MTEEEDDFGGGDFVAAAKRHSSFAGALHLPSRPAIACSEDTLGRMFAHIGHHAR